MELYRVSRIGEADYGCEELPEGAPVLCEVELAGPARHGRGRTAPRRCLCRTPT